MSVFENMIFQKTFYFSSTSRTLNINHPLPSYNTLIDHKTKN